jgi:two-component system sensor histidine kinase TctE
LRKPFRTDKKHRHSSLFGEIADWLLAPFLILWPISMAVEYSLAYSVAAAAYDRELKNTVIAVASRVSTSGDSIQADMPPAAVAVMRAQGVEDTVHQVRDARGGLIDGNASLPGVTFGPGHETGTVYFRDDSADGRDMRVAYTFVQPPGAVVPSLVQVGETDKRRVQLASDVSRAVFTAQLLILPIALLLVWFGLTEGFTALEDIRDKIRNRKSEDLSPIDPAEAPEEVRSFIVSINDLMMRLEMSLKAQQRFVADAAHQMRTPLAGLKTQAELALRQNDSAGIEYSIRQIAAGADRASRLINQLLALARADSDAPPPIERMDLGVLAQETARDWFDKASDKRIDLGFESGGQPCFIEGNSILLRELLNNLLDNAIRYTPAGGSVTVRLRAADAIELEVEDNGIGIDLADRELVFERFYRVLGTDAEGSGLGLAIVREIAELHGARVELEANAQGPGTVFRVAFPRSKAAAQLLRPAA